VRYLFAEGRLRYLFGVWCLVSGVYPFAEGRVRYLFAEGRVRYLFGVWCLVSGVFFRSSSIFFKVVFHFFLGCLPFF